MAKSSDQVGEAIRQMRRQTGLTQVQLANEVGLTPTTIYRYEAGTRPDASALLALFAFSEKHSLTAITNILRAAISDRSDVPQGFFRAYMERKQGRSIDKQPVDPSVQAAAAAMAHLPQRDKDLALAFIAFLLENTDLTADGMVRHILQEWESRGEKIFGKPDSEDPSDE